MILLYDGICFFFWNSFIRIWYKICDAISWNSFQFKWTTNDDWSLDQSTNSMEHSNHSKWLRSGLIHSNAITPIFIFSWIVFIHVVQHQLQHQQTNQHHDQRISPRHGQHSRPQDQLNRLEIVPIIINTVPHGPPLVSVARIQLIWINIVVNHVGYAEAVVVEEAAPMPVLIATTGHSMVIADRIMHIWVSLVDKHVVCVDISWNPIMWS